MTITAEDIKQLKEMTKKRYGRTLSDDEAVALGNRLLNLFEPMVSQFALDLKEDKSHYETRK